MEPIAIVGLGCRFPGANHPAEFWQLLRNGGEAITEVPKERWDINHFYDPDPNTPGGMSTRWGGFIDQIDGFDADFFGMSATEVEHTDPQQRLFLEVAWEALEHAGIVPTQLAGSQTGVFIGLCTIDYHRLLYKDVDCLGPYSGTGTTPCITANRLSYLLDLRGPSLSIDAACASSLVTVHLACQSLRSGESDLCLAGGVNLILSPDSMIASSQTRLLSAEGRCKPFDASADGYVRGEGCGVVVLKRFSDALRDGDSVLALVQGSAVNQDGLSNSLTAPNGLAQQALIRQAWKNAQVRSTDISYVEAHAVGTTIGDAIEFKALKTVLMEGRADDQPCWIGSAKPNIGHLEAASGIAALIKVVLALQHEEIPPHLHLQQLNPYISLDHSTCVIPTQLQPWPRSTESRLAGISAFGFGGTNAHLVLAEAPVPPPKQPQAKHLHHLFTLSAKTDQTLRELAEQYDTLLASQSDHALADLCSTTNTGRTHFNHRLCIVTPSIDQLRQQLQALITEKKTVGVFQGKVKGRKRTKAVFIYSGEPSIDATQVGDLYQTQPTFRQACDRCAKILQISSDDAATDHSSLAWLTEILLQPLGVFVIEYALTELWQSWGIAPKAVTGDGVGAYGAACAAGVFSLEAALTLVAARSQVGPDSRWTEPADAPFAAMAQTISYAQPRIPLICGQTGRSITAEMATPEYWCQPLPQTRVTPLKPEYLADYDQWLRMDLQTAPGLTDRPLAPPDARPPAAGLNLLHNLAKLYVQGVAIDWSGFNRDRPQQRLPLPTYPFQRQRYWFKPSRASPVHPK
jgi:acyl transferase domain-containing protein